jgi:hypothetical protein
VTTIKNQRMAGYSGSEIGDDEETGEVRVSDVAMVEEEEMAKEGEQLSAPEALPETSQAAVADAVQDIPSPSR